MSEIVKTVSKQTEAMESTPKKELEVGQIEELDAGELFLRENGMTHAFVQELLGDEARVKKLMRRVDLTLLPLLCGTFLLQFIDKQALSYGAVFDLLTANHLSSYEYSWLGSIFYFDYLFAEYPTSYLGQIFPIGTVISIFVIIWGSVMMLTVASSSFAGLAVTRFLLGCFEAPISPLFIMIVGMWYLRKDQPFRAGIFYSCNGLGVMVGGLMNYGIGHVKGFPIWKVTYLACGGATILWGILLFLLLPTNITTAKRFTVEERAMLIGRNAANRTGIYNKKIKLYQIKEALTDAQVWILFFFTFLNETINGGYATFGKLIVKGIVSDDALLTTLYSFPSGAFLTVFILTGTYLASRFKNVRTLVMALYLIPTILGTCLIWQLPRTNKYGLLLGYYIITSFVASLVIALQLSGSNMGGYTKRMTSTCFVFLAYCGGNIAGPQAFKGSESPVYPTGCKTIIGCAAGQVVCVIALRLLLIRRNKLKEAARQAAGLTDENALNESTMADITDFENPQFRYVL